MGFLPKHVKRRRHREAAYYVAVAALSGCTFLLMSGSGRLRYGRWPSVPRQWAIEYPDGKISHSFPTKADAAVFYLMWWFSKNGIWPGTLRRPL